MAFSVAQLLLMGSGNRVQVVLWICASFFSAIGTAFAPHLLTVVSVANFGVWGGLATLVGGVFRFLALSYRKRSFDRNRPATVFLWVSLIGLIPAVMPQLAAFRLLFSSIVGASISIACFLAMLRNPFWKSRNNLALALTLVGMGISAIILIARGLTSYPFGVDQTFVGESSLQRRAFESLVMISFFLQVGFTGMLVARRNREGIFADRRAVRLAQRTLRLRRRNQEIAETARDRLDLVQLLTHEVRQPITNALASLQSISFDLRSAHKISRRGAMALERAQTSLDHITLALSNIIVASTLVSNERKWEPQEIDALSILEMARLDFRPEDQARIVIREAEENVYLSGVPILLRVTLQNILDHALKLSSPGQDILVELSIDAAHGQVVFDIGFRSEKLAELDPSLFERRRSNDTDRSDVSPLGLFVVRQVARELAGEIRACTKPAGRLSFQLALPY